MKKMRIVLATLLLMVLSGCAGEPASQNTEGNSERQAQSTNVKARYVEAKEKAGKQQIYLEMLNGGYGDAEDVVATVKVEGKDKDGKTISETLKAATKLIKPGEIKKVRVKTKKITEVKKVTIESVEG